MTTPFGDNPTFLNFDSSAPRDRHQRVRRRRARPRTRASVIHTPEIPYWETDPEAWDQITFDHGGAEELVFFGLVEVTGQGPGVKLDTRTAHGQDGARQVDRGYEPAELDIKITIWTEDQLEDYRALMARVIPRRPSERGAIRVYYPSLAAMRIDRITVKRVSPLVRGAVPGSMEFTLHVLEYAPPTAAPSRAVTTNRVGSQLANAQTALPAPVATPSAFLPPSATQAGP